MAVILTISLFNILLFLQFMHTVQVCKEVYLRVTLKWTVMWKEKKTGKAVCMCQNKTVNKWNILKKKF